MTQGPIQRAVRVRITSGTTLRTVARGAPFVVDVVDGNGIVLLLGAGRWRVVLPWDCIEGIGGLLRGRDWVDVGGKYQVEGEPGTLDGYLKHFTKTSTANWIAKVLAEAEVVDLGDGRPLRVRLRSGF